MFGIGPLELVVILLIALVVVGPQKLPEVGKSIGKAMREFKKAQDEIKGAISFDLDTQPAPHRPAPHRPRPSVADDAGSTDEASAPQNEPPAATTTAADALESMEAEDRATESPAPATAADDPIDPE